MYSSQNREGSVKFWLTDKFTFSNENLAHVPFSSHWWLTGTQMSYFTLFRNFTPRHGPRWKLLGKVSIQQQKSYLLPAAAILSFSFHKTIITKSIERFSGWTKTFIALISIDRFNNYPLYQTIQNGLELWLLSFLQFIHKFKNKLWFWEFSTWLSKSRIKASWECQPPTPVYIHLPDQEEHILDSEWPTSCLVSRLPLCQLASKPLSMFPENS